MQRETTTWAQPLIAGGEEPTWAVTQLNKALEAYQQAVVEGSANSDFLNDLIDKTQNYFDQCEIDYNRLSRTLVNGQTIWVHPSFPNIARALEIQHRAVRLLYMPDNDDALPRKRWQLIRQLLSEHLDENTRGKILSGAEEEKYWGEMRFRGQVAIAQWVKGSSPKFKTFQDVENEIRSAGQDTLEKPLVQYVENPEQYRLTILDGKAFFRSEPADTSRSSGVNEKTNTCIFVAGKDGKIYINDPNVKLLDSFHHSSFLRGKPVMCAGSLKIREGEIREITVESGHYRPGRRELLSFLKLLQSQKVDLSKITVIHSLGAPVAADKYLKMSGYALPAKKRQRRLLFRTLPADISEHDARVRKNSGGTNILRNECRSRQPNRII